MSDYAQLEIANNFLEIIAGNGGGGGGGSNATDIMFLNNTPIAIDQGTHDGGTLRVVLASNDPSIDPRNNTYFTYNVMGGNSRQIVNSAYIPFAAATNNLPSTNPDTFKPSFDDLHIVPADAMHDDQAGDSARSVLFEYYDSTNTLQSATELLGADTTFVGVRRVVTFKVVTWGAANKYNYSDILLMNLADSDLIAIIPGLYNISPKFQQEVPLNGRLWLDSLELTSMEDTNADQNVKIRIIARTYDGTNNYDEILFASGVPYQQTHRWDLRNLPYISGPTAYGLSNISVMLVGAEEGGAGATTKASGHLSYHIA
jgi:hypothetical protein